MFPHRPRAGTLTHGVPGSLVGELPDPAPEAPVDRTRPAPAPFDDSVRSATGRPQGDVQR
ncbi:hypothetical protein KNE206_18110 [Kitasatospora sp. NE20-6]